jgi:RNA polymerase sigma-70 factor (ECF subfamily)
MDAVISEAGLIPHAGRMDPERSRAREALDLGAVFDEHAAALYRTILAYTGGRGDLAEEAVAEAFARATAFGGKLRDPVAWLYRVTFNVANDELRREQSHSSGEPVEAVFVPSDLNGVFDALRSLPLRERAAMVLFYVLDLPVSEVASRMGIAAPTVRVHLMKGRRRLRDLLGDDEVDD